MCLTYLERDSGLGRFCRHLLPDEDYLGGATSDLAGTTSVLLDLVDVRNGVVM